MLLHWLCLLGAALQRRQAAGASCRCWQQMHLAVLLVLLVLLMLLLLLVKQPAQTQGASCQQPQQPLTLLRVMQQQQPVAAVQQHQVMP